MAHEIEVGRLTKRYGDTVSVDDLSFTVEPGVVTGFLGPNGAGKSTTMRVILGLDAPTSGSATVHGRNYAELPAPMREVGSLLDARAVHGSRTAYHHLLCLAQSNGISRTRIREVLEIVGLDPEGIRWVRGFIRGLAGEGRTVLVRTPDSQRFAHTLRAAGAALDMWPDGVLVVGGLASADIGDLAVADDIALHELTPHQSSLEDAFMELTRESVQYASTAEMTPGTQPGTSNNDEKMGIA